MEYKRVTKRLENGTPFIDCKALGCEYFDYGCEMDYNCCERAADHLAELEDKIEQGKMIELPFITQDARGTWRVHFYSTRFNTIDCYICYDREEAEKRLKELQG